MFKYDVSDSKWIHVETLISPASLSYFPTIKRRGLDDIDGKALDKFVCNQR